MIVALAALEAGLVTPDETVNCPGHMDLATAAFTAGAAAGTGG